VQFSNDRSDLLISHAREEIIKPLCAIFRSTKHRSVMHSIQRSHSVCRFFSFRHAISVMPGVWVYQLTDKGLADPCIRNQHSPAAWSASLPLPQLAAHPQVPDTNGLAPRRRSIRPYGTCTACSAWNISGRRVGVCLSASSAARMVCTAFGDWNGPMKNCEFASRPVSTRHWSMLV